MAQRGPRLRPQLGLVDATAIALGAIIGAGIFVVLGEAAGVAGAGTPLAVLFAAGVAAFSGLSAAQLGVNYPRVGGAYEFGYELLVPIVGFTAGLSFLLGSTVGSAALTLTFASYLQALAPGIPLRVIAVALALLAVAVNVAGVQQSRRTNNLLVAFKVAVLLIFVLVGLAARGRWQPGTLSAGGIGNLPRASALFFFAYTGYSRPVTIVEEIRDPARTLPRSMIAALAISTSLYLAVALVAQGLVGADALAASPAPLRAALAPTSQAWAQTLISVGALVATADVLLTGIWGMSRVILAMSRRGDLPGALCVLTGQGVPRNAILASGIVVIVLSAIGNLGQVVAATSLALLLYYAIMNSAALRLAPRQRLYPVLVPVAGLLSTLALAFTLPLTTLLVVGVTLLVGVIYFLLRHRR